MKDTLHEAVKLGLGVADLTREKVEQFVDRLEKEYPGEMRDGRKRVDDIMAEAHKQSKKLQERIDAAVAKAIKDQQLVKEKDLRELRKQLQAVMKTGKRIAKDAVKRKPAAPRKTAKAKKASKTARKKK